MRRYIHVFPVSEFFGELRDCYSSASERLTWMSTDSLASWNPDRLEWSDPAVVLVFWGRWPEVPERRRATVVFRYTESVGDPEGLAQVQRDLMESFAAKARVPDLLLAGCPAVADYWSRMCRAVAVAPIGYEPAVLGSPNWEAKKKFSVGFRGSYIDRRVWALKRLERRFSGKFRWVHGFGETRRRELDTCLVDLYIGHSVEYGFPGARIWQAIASSAVLATERRDAWPAVPGRHYIELPVMDHDRPNEFLAELANYIHDSDLRDISTAAHYDLSKYTVDRCMNEYVVPAVEAL